MSWQNFCDLLPGDIPADIPREIDDPKIGRAALIGAYDKFPEVNGATVIKVRYRNEAGKTERPWYRVAGVWQPTQPPGYTLPLYGLHSITNGHEVIVTEGPKKAAALHRQGLQAVAFSGTGHADSVDLTPLLKLPNVFILWGDNDGAGAVAMNALAARLDRPHKRVDPAKLDLPEKGDSADLVADLVTQWGVPEDWTGTSPYPRDAGFHPDEILMEQITPALVDVSERLTWQTLPSDWLTVAIPPRDFVFNGAVPVDCVTLQIASGGTGKSTLALEQAVSVATGRELLPGFAAIQRGRVALLALEDDLAEIHRRLQRIARAFDFDDYDADLVRQNLRVLPVPTFETFTIDSTGELKPGRDLLSVARYLTSLQPRLIILDPLAALLGGAIEENSNEAAQTVVGIIRGAMPTGAGVLIACHVAKTDRLEAFTARGASAWMDAARQVLALRPLDATEAKNVPDGDSKANYVALEIRKSNYAALRPPLYLRRNLEPAKAGTLSIVDFAAMKATAEAAKSRIIREAILEVLPTLDSDGVTRQEISGHGGKTGIERGRFFRDAVSEKAKFSVTRNMVDCAVSEMLSDGTLSQTACQKRQILQPTPTHAEPTQAWPHNPRQPTPPTGDNLFGVGCPRVGADVDLVTS